MDDSKKLHDGEIEDEKAFTETLSTDPGVERDSGYIPKTKDIPAPSAEVKAGAKQPPWVGKIMGHFKLLRLIGEGATGLVIQAEDITLKRIVALKVLRKQLSAGDKGKEFVEQFLREARAAASIEHPNIVRVYEINQHAGWWYIAMEMVSGNSLQEIIKAAGSLSASRACPIIADAAVALQVAHELGMIHRDIKPSNILLTRNGRGKVSDFGLVRVDDPNDPVDTYAHQSIGTPHYMAPEMIRRETISPAVDIYSLGGTLYYILTGRTPYAAENMKDILKQHLNARPPDLLEYLPDSSSNLASLIQRMMAKEPSARPTAAEVAAILHAESITSLPDISGSTGTGTTTLDTEWQGIFQKTRISMSGQTAHAVNGSSSKLPGGFPLKVRTLRQILSAVMVVLIAGGLWVYLYTSHRPGQDRLSVSRLFPRAPTSYGTRNAGTLPGQSIPADIPAFSWKGKIDTSGIQFVASKNGSYFYSIDDKRAILIRADQYVGYKTAQEAMKDSKQPAPQE